MLVAKAIDKVAVADQHKASFSIILSTVQEVPISYYGYLHQVG